jgi:hypothetical protein
MAITATQKVLTLDYWKSADKIKIGDYVFNQNGQAVQVKLVQHYYADECYRVVFDDELTMEGDKHLGFLIQDQIYRIKICKYKGIRRFRRKLKFTKLEAILKEPLVDYRNRKKYSVPTTLPINFPHQLLGVPPFVFGFWLYNKNVRNEMKPPPKYEKLVRDKFIDSGYKILDIVKLPKGVHKFTTSPSIESQWAPNIPRSIPSNYMFGSIEQRTELLSGIMHSKSGQYDAKTGTFRFTSYHYGTVLQIQCLVESLGSKTKIHHSPHYNYYTIYFKHKIKLLEEHQPKPIKVHLEKRYIKRIEPIQSQMCVHIETTGNDNSILSGEGFISTC